MIPYIEGDGIQAIQKTYKDGTLVTGRDVNDLMVV